MELRVGRRSDELASLLRKCEANGFAIITAWNPLSEQRLMPENMAAQQRLSAALDSKGLRHYRGVGVDSSWRWPSEDSEFVFGIDLQTATLLGTEFQQNGIVIAIQDAIPRLVLLR